MGLDRDDTIIRRRLRQKLEFLVEDDVAESRRRPTPSSQAGSTQHPDAFRVEPRVAFRQVYVSPDAAARAAADARRSSPGSRAAGPGARIDALGDRVDAARRSWPRGPLRDVAAVFGDGVRPADRRARAGPLDAARRVRATACTWCSCRERVEARMPRSPTSARWSSASCSPSGGKAQLAAIYERLLAKYTVAIEMPRDRRARARRSGAPAR